MNKEQLIRSFESFILGNWWVIAAYLLFFAVYESASSQTEQIREDLITRIESLEDQIYTANLTNEYYANVLSSVSDPAWIEMQLIRKLGLVPKRQKKILFRKS